MKSLAISYRGMPRRRRTILLAALAVALSLAPITARYAKAQSLPSVPLNGVNIPALPSSADLKSLLSLLPAAPDPDQFDLTKADQVKALLEALPVNVFHPTYKLNDEPGSWFDTGLTVAGGKSLGVVLKLPGVPTKATFVVTPETGVDTLHTVTSLIRPVGAAPMDQASGFNGTRDYDFKVPGL